MKQIFGKDDSHLVSVKCNSDKQDEYKNQVTFSAQELKSLIAEYDESIVLDENQENWIEIVSHDDAYSKSIGYVQEIRVGDKTFSGYTFVNKIVKSFQIESTCFTVSYDSEKQEFTFKYFGKGHGVGMSMHYAKILAGSSTKYKKILQSFYNGTVIMNDPIDEE